MHICFVGEGIHPPWIRGHQNLTRELVSCLKGKAEVSLITTRMERSSPYSNQFPQFTKQLENLIEVKGSRNSYLDSFRLSKAFNKFARGNRVDIVHLTQINIGVFAALNRLSPAPKCKVIRQYFMSLPEKNISNAFMNPLLYFIYSKLTDRVAVTSPLVKEWLSKRINPEKIFLLPLPVDTEFFKPLENKRFTGNEGPCTILYMGSISRRRLPLSVLHALKMLKDRGINVFLLVIGRYDNEYSKSWVREIKETATDLGLDKNAKVEVKALNEAEKLSLYNSVDLVIFPFEGYVEVTDPPITLLEAMSCGRVVLASRVYSMPYLINHGVNGFLLDSLEAEEIANKIELGLNSSWNEICGNARNTILTHFSKEKVAEDLIHLYQSLVN